MRSYRIPQDDLKHVALTPASQVTGIIGFCHHTHFISLCFHFLSALGTTLCSSYRHMITPDSLFPEALKAKRPSHGRGLTIILTTEVFISEHTRISDLHVREGILRAMADHVSVLQRAHLLPGPTPVDPVHSSDEWQPLILFHHFKDVCICGSFCSARLPTSCHGPPQTIRGNGSLRLSLILGLTFLSS